MKRARLAGFGLAAAFATLALPAAAGWERELERIGTILDTLNGAPPEVQVAQSGYAEAPPPLAFSGSPTMVVVPSGDAYVYMVPRTYGVYFHGGWWYRFHAGAWYRAADYAGPWGWIEARFVPGFVAGVPPDYALYLPSGYRHIPYRDFHSHWREWDRSHAWHRHDWYRHEMRPEVVRERHAFIERKRAEDRHAHPRPDRHDVRPERHDVRPDRHEARPDRHERAPRPDAHPAPHSGFAPHASPSRAAPPQPQPQPNRSAHPQPSSQPSRSQGAAPQGDRRTTPQGSQSSRSAPATTQGTRQGQGSGGPSHASGNRQAPAERGGDRSRGDRSRDEQGRR